MAITPPRDLWLAMKMGLCRYIHDTKVYYFPPTPPQGVERKIRPLKDEYARESFGMSLGAMSPSPPTDKVYVTHSSAQMKKHDDPWAHSLIDDPYPLFITVTHNDPHVFTMHNNTGKTQKVDLTFHYMVFERREDWEKYKDMIESRYRVPEILKDIKKALSPVSALTKIKEAVK